MSYHLFAPRIVATVALIAATSQCLAQQSAQQLPANWISADSKIIAVVEVAKFLDGPEKDSIAEISSLHPIVLTSALREAEDATGLKPSDVVRLDVSEELPAGFVVAIETVGRPQIEMLQSKLAAGAGPTTFANRTHYVGEKFALFPIQSQTAIVGAPPAVEAVMTRLERSPAQTTVLPPLEGADSALLDIAVTPASMSGIAEELTGAPPEVAALLKADQIRIRVEPAKTITFRLIARFPNEAAAENGVVGIEFAASQLVAYLKTCEQQMPLAFERFAKQRPGAERLSPMFVHVIQAASAALQNATIKREGSVVSLACSIPSGRPVTDAILLLSLLPRAAK